MILEDKLLEKKKKGSKTELIFRVVVVAFASTILSFWCINT